LRTTGKDLSNSAGGNFVSSSSILFLFISFVPLSFSPQWNQWIYILSFRRYRLVCVLVVQFRLSAGNVSRPNTRVDTAWRLCNQGNDARNLMSLATTYTHIWTCLPASEALYGIWSAVIQPLIISTTLNLPVLTGTRKSPTKNNAEFHCR